MQHSSLSSVPYHYSSRPNSSRLAAVRPPASRVPSADEEVKTKDEVSSISIFPWANGKSSSSSSSNSNSSSERTTNRSTAFPDKVDHDDDHEELSSELMAAGAIAGFLAIAAALSAASSFDFSSIHAVAAVEGVIKDPSAALDQVVQTVEAMGPLGAVYFGVVYTLAEVLAIPAIPLTASAGYLFGPVEGTAVVLFSASIAAGISFMIGRTLLRDYVENVLKDYPKFAKLDRAIGKEGFKLMLLLRMSPIFPFALSNYLYGASSINFPAFFWGTLFGFAPGTIAFVCTGAFGKALSAGGENNYPWFVYVGGLTLLGGLLKILADTAARVVEEMEEEEDTI